MQADVGSFIKRKGKEKGKRRGKPAPGDRSSGREEKGRKRETEKKTESWRGGGQTDTERETKACQPRQKRGKE